MEIEKVHMLKFIKFMSESIFQFLPTVQLTLRCTSTGVTIT